MSVGLPQARFATCSGAASPGPRTCSTLQSRPHARPEIQPIDDNPTRKANSPRATEVKAKAAGRGRAGTRLTLRHPRSRP